MSDNNHCNNRRESIAALVLGELEADAAEELKEHISTCQTCRSLYQALTYEEQTICSAFNTITDRSKPLHDDLVAQLEEQPHRPLKKSTLTFKAILNSPITKLAAAAVIILAATLALHSLVGDGTNIAFGEILENLRYVRTLHATFYHNGKEAEVWAKRPNMLRMQYDNGTYEISNGPEWWIVDEKNNKAARKPSWYFKHAQRRGVDVLDFLFQADFSDDFSGFLAEEPVGQVEQNGKIFDLYQMQTAYSGGTLKFEALVDAETHLVHSVSLETHKQNQVKKLAKLNIIEYDQPVSEKMFVFEPPETMEVTIAEPEPSGPEQVPSQIEGSTVSGRITWASSGKPVVEARLSFWTFAPDGKAKYFGKSETDREGSWRIEGVPQGRIDMHVRSWELDWPAVPTFTTYEGSPQSPMISVDGQSHYTGFNFKVYKPDDLCSRITVAVTDEHGNPIEGAAASIHYDGPPGGMHQHLYAGPGQQCTGPDGKFDALNIWPSMRPVRVSVGAGSPYVRRPVDTEPFVIKPKESYHFDIVLQHAAQMKIQVVDPQNKPLEGVSVLALDTKWFPFSTGFEDLVFTDSDGLAQVDGMAPAEDVIIAIRRLEPKAERPRKTFASLFVPATAPPGPDKPTRLIVFDERPISIEGTCDSTFQPHKHVIFVMPAGVPRYHGAPFGFLRADFDDAGRFLLQGVPAGDILLLCKDTGSDRTVAQQSIHTAPGNTYIVKISSHGLQLIGHKPNL